MPPGQQAIDAAVGALIAAFRYLYKTPANALRMLQESSCGGIGYGLWAHAAGL